MEPRLHRRSSVVRMSIAISRPAKTAEPIEMSFGMSTRLRQRKHVLEVVAHWRNLANANEPFMCGSDVAFCQTTVTTCFVTSNARQVLDSWRVASLSTAQNKRLRLNYSIRSYPSVAHAVNLQPLLIHASFDPIESALDLRVPEWPGDVMVKALARDSRGREFNSRPSRCLVTTFGKLFTHMCLCHQAV